MIIMSFLFDEYEFQPWLQEKLHVHDTCGVHNLHGMPAVLGAILSCIMAAVANPIAYGGNSA